MENSITEVITKLVFQLGVILLVAKLSDEVFERYFKLPGVLGELIGGMIIGPYLLGGYIHIPGVGALFSLHDAGNTVGEVVSTIPVSPELYSVAQIAVIILLFVAGIETDLRQFLRYVAPATLVGLVGVVVPFIFGAATTVIMGLTDSLLSKEALFMGAIMTATSVGITARVLSDIKSMDKPEAVTILAAAVVDDVLGILVLTIVVSLTKGGEFSLLNIGIIGGKAFGFWVVLTGVGILVSSYISRFILRFRSEGAGVALALSLAFFASAVAELFGLAMIIGAYSIGLALSDTEVAEILKEKLLHVYHAFVPIFFVVMGMLVDFSAMKGVIIFSLIITFLAIIGKVVGCGLPALVSGFNMRGAYRIGIGMLPRGEVALIVAGIGLSSGAIGRDIFGVAIFMTFVTTLMAPILLVPAFNRGGSGKRRRDGEEIQD